MVKKAKGGRVKKQLGGVMPGAGAAGVQRPLGAAGVQRPLGGGVLPGARMIKKGGAENASCTRKISDGRH